MSPDDVDQRRCLLCHKQVTSNHDLATHQCTPGSTRSTSTRPTDFSARAELVESIASESSALGIPCDKRALMRLDIGLLRPLWAHLVARRRRSMSQD